MKTTHLSLRILFSLSDSRESIRANRKIRVIRVNRHDTLKK